MLDIQWIRNGISYLQLQHPNRLFQSSDGRAGLGFRAHRGFALVPGPPIGPPEAWAALVREFETTCRAQGLTVAFCGLAGFGREVLESLGYRSLKIGDEAVVELPGDTLRGREWRECRGALNRAERQGTCFSWVAPEQRTGPLAQELREVSDAWLRQKRTPELGFALGTHEELFDENTRLGVARDGSGRAIGFVTWVPVPQQNGWMLDMMRRRPDAMAGLMDFLIIQSLQSLGAVGYAWGSLGGVPLSNVGREKGGALRTALDVAFQRGRVYRPAALFHFKDKFNPSWRPLYLTCEDRAHPARALLAMASASLPGARLGRFILTNLL